MIKIGLTGNIGSGKTTVARVWQTMGARVIDVDELAHELYCPRTRIWQKVVKVFGKGILKADKTVNRAKLGKIVFSDKKKMAKLNSLMYPAILKELKKQLVANKSKAVIADMAVLFEAKAEKLFDKIVLVKVSSVNQLKRLTKNRRLTRKEALNRIKHTVFPVEKISCCDYLIDGDKPKKEVQSNSRALLKTILKPEKE